MAIANALDTTDTQFYFRHFFWTTCLLFLWLALFFLSFDKLLECSCLGCAATVVQISTFFFKNVYGIFYIGVGCMA